ncbi:MAG: methyltransferase type 11 [Paracoccaceae bacterium]|nr:MAG: methyltransferase type 11 [Paracoccaceae bacterium]
MTGPVQDSWDAARYAAAARFVTDLGAPVLELLDARPGERILDLGCGDGVLTARIAALGARVLGVDSSPDMIAAARARGVEARLADAHALDFCGEFDAVFSNAALHWMTDPDRVIAGVARALVRGGRFVAEAGGHGNVAAIRTALIAVLERHGRITDLGDIWYFPTVAEQRRRLERAGLTVTDIALIPRPTPVIAGMEAWLDTLAGPALALIPEADRPAARAEVVRLVAPALRDSAGNWTADYVRLRFRAVKR